LGSFSFHTGHGGRKHGDWIGLMADVGWNGTDLSRAGFKFVRHNDRNETVVCVPADEVDAVAEITEASAAIGTRVRVAGDGLSIELAGG
jgi:hypothetical protein